MRRFELLLNGKAYLVEVTRLGVEGALVNVNGVQYEVGINDLSQVRTRTEMPKTMKVAEAPPQVAAAPPRPQRQVQAETVGGLTTIKAPLPGLIVKVKVAVGDQVKPGDVILVIETMKMENNVVSPCAGTVKEIKISENMTVNEGMPLIVIGE